VLSWIFVAFQQLLLNLIQAYKQLSIVP